VADHRVALGTYDEPGITWTRATCGCGWEGPLRQSSAQGAVDAGWHLMDPALVVFGDDWHKSDAEDLERLYRQFTPAWSPRL